MRLVKFGFLRYTTAVYFITLVLTNCCLTCIMTKENARAVKNRDKTKHIK